MFVWFPCRIMTNSIVALQNRHQIKSVWNWSFGNLASFLKGHLVQLGWSTRQLTHKGILKEKNCKTEWCTASCTNMLPIFILMNIALSLCLWRHIVQVPQFPNFCTHAVTFCQTVKIPKQEARKLQNCITAGEQWERKNRLRKSSIDRSVLYMLWKTTGGGGWQAE